MQPASLPLTTDYFPTPAGAIVAARHRRPSVVRSSGLTARAVLASEYEEFTYLLANDSDAVDALLFELVAQRLQQVVVVACRALCRALRRSRLAPGLSNHCAARRLRRRQRRHCRRVGARRDKLHTVDTDVVADVLCRCGGQR